MVEDNKLNQEKVIPQPIEDVFSDVDGLNSDLKEDINLPKDSFKQEDSLEKKQINEIINNKKIKNQSSKIGKILFYLIFILIILLGGFAIWALVF